ncbi:MAG: hypothetical protein COT37_02295 [Parcubacteria group bacterium CG08_land_8_20_14_0_20_43_9]|nr:MAG: hypothetical protein COT37_02295 [Parcubacteria group bacterium CG08_land_8_20_14_0_20_43_9]
MSRVVEVSGPPECTANYLDVKSIPAFSIKMKRRSVHRTDRLTPYSGKRPYRGMGISRQRVMGRRTASADNPATATAKRQTQTTTAFALSAALALYPPHRIFIASHQFARYLHNAIMIYKSQITKTSLQTERFLF